MFVVIMEKDCIFCKIVSGELPCHKVWEDKKHLAFLSIYPNTEGATVVMPKEHYTSYAFDQQDLVISELIIASKKVAKILDTTFDDVGRTALVLEGFGINHLHSKLFPLHGTQITSKKWTPIESKIDTYFEKYPGYVCSNDSIRADDAKLRELAKKIVEKRAKLK